MHISVSFRVLGMLLMLAICIEAGDLVNQFLFSQGVTLPGFLTAMLIGIVIVKTCWKKPLVIPVVVTETTTARLAAPVRSSSSTTRAAAASSEDAESKPA